MAREFFKNLPNTTTPLTAPRLNALLDGDEPMGNIVVDSIKTKNIFGNFVPIRGYIYGTSMRTGIYMPDRLALIPCSPNTTYTVSRSVITSSFRVGDCTEIPQVVSTYTDITIPSIIENNNGTIITYTTSSTAKYLIIHYANTNNDSSTTIQNSLAGMQVEKNSEATTFSPYQQLDKFEIQTGSGIVDTTYIDTAENNHYEKIGNVVSYSFTMKVKGTWNNTTRFIEGLPEPKTETRFLGLNTSTGDPMRFAMRPNGQVENAYSRTLPAAGAIIEGHVVYISDN